MAAFFVRTNDAARCALGSRLNVAELSGCMGVIR